MAFGFVLMGGWAVLANRGHPMPAPLVAGLAQGTMSALLTGVFKAIMDRILGFMAQLPQLRRWRHIGGMVAAGLTGLVIFALSITILHTVHRLVGTPELNRTILVPVTVVTFYALVYSAIRWRRL
jgi:hypothetical protein